MNKPLHIKLLETLESIGVSERYNFSNFIVENFKKPTATTQDKWNVEVKPSQMFLKDLCYRGFIEIEDNDTNFMLVHFGNENSPQTWYDSLEIHGHLKTNGLDYLDQYRLNNTLKESNKSSVRNFTTQKFISIVTIVIAAGTAFLGYLTYRYSVSNDTKLNQLELHVSQLEKQLKEIQPSKTIEQNQLTSPAVPSRKRQPSSVSK
jgi:hypothetical protein